MYMWVSNCKSGCLCMGPVKSKCVSRPADLLELLQSSYVCVLDSTLRIAGLCYNKEAYLISLVVTDTA